MKRNAWKAARGSAGFTLVELVVVIAILGILAGVGTVGYSGYIQRANEAVDETTYQNIVYAGEIGKYANPGVEARVNVTASGASVTSTVPGNDEIVKQWLAAAFGDNWDETVKYKTEKYLDNDMYSAFTLPVRKGIDLSEDEKEWLDKYEDSNFHGNETELAGAVDDLSGMLADWMENGSGVSALEGFLGADYQKFLDDYVNNPDYVSDPNDLQQVANAMVFYLADKAGEATAEDVFGMATDENGNIDPNKLTEVMKEYGTLPTAGMLYGLMTGYANSDLASEAFKTQFKENPPTGVDDVLGMLQEMGSDANSGQYFKDQGKQDLDGYLSALQLIGNHKDDIDITLDFGEDGGAFNNDSVLALLQGILNGK